jgi:uncharacterized protein
MSPRAIVTGASEGIGRALALALGRAGYSVTAVARNAARLEELMGEMVGEDHLVLVADLATSEGVAEVVAAMRGEHVSLLVNNAGVGAVGDFAQIPLDRQVAMIRVNVEALTILSHAFLQQAVAGDHLANISSVVAFLPQPAQPVYSATKAFVTTLTETLWQEARKKGIHVFAVHPGPTDTAFSERAGRKDLRPRPSFVRQVPEEVAAELLRALEGPWGPHVVSGLSTRLAVAFGRLLPKKLLLALVGRLAP